VSHIRRTGLIHWCDSSRSLSAYFDQAKRLGDEAFKSKDYDKAIEQYTEAIKENPRYTQNAQTHACVLHTGIRTRHTHHAAMDSLLLFQERIAIKTRSALKQERRARRYLSVLMNF